MRSRLLSKVGFALFGITACGPEGGPDTGAQDTEGSSSHTSPGDPAETDEDDPSVCGNGVVEPGELCDDGNTDDTDECTVFCQPPACDDGILSGDESDVDCGGSCGPCESGDGCVDDSDCASGICEEGVCVDCAGPWTKVTESEATWADGLTVDATGHAYLVGYVLGDLDGEQSAGNRDAFITKYSGDGTRAWTRLLGSTHEDTACDVSTDPQGNVYVTGETYGDLGGQTNSGTQELFVAKFSAAGVPKWVRLVEVELENDCATIDADAHGNVYVAGLAHDAYEDGGEDIFVARYDANGNQHWFELLGAEQPGGGHVATDSLGNVYVAGKVRGDFNGEEGDWDGDAFVVKYSSAGERQWTRLVGANSGDTCDGITIHDNDDVSITGHPGGNFDGLETSSSADIFITKFRSDGTKLWSSVLDLDPEVETAWRPTDIANDRNDNFYVVGRTRDEFDDIPNAGKRDVFVLGLNPDASLRWGALIGSVEEDYAAGIATDGHGNVFAAGSAYGPLPGYPELDPAEGFVSMFCPQ